MVLKWWHDNRHQYPCLYQAAKGLLHTPATSVPSERIFSEADYIARERRSKILPINLNRHLFLKRNEQCVPVDDLEKFTDAFAAQSLDNADNEMPQHFPNMY